MRKLLIILVLVASCGQTSTVPLDAGLVEKLPPRPLGVIGSPPPTGGGGAGGGGDITAVTVSGVNSGGGTSGSVNIGTSETGCLAGDAWSFVSTGVWSCDPMGDLTAVAATSPISVATGTGPIPNVSLSTTGCIDGETWQRVGGNWACEPVGDLTEVQATAPIGVTSGTGPVPTAFLTSTNCEQGAPWVWNGSAFVCQSPDDISGLTWGCSDEMTGAVDTAAIGTCGIGIISGGAITASGVTDVTHPGSRLWTLDAATDRVTLITGNSTVDTMFFGAGANSWAEAIVQLNALSNGTDTYTLRAGFLDVVNADAVDGAYFELNSNADGEFQCKTAANSVRTTASPDSGVTAAATTWYKLRVEVDAATTARFYINGTLVCTIATNIPTGAGRATQVGISFIASLGTGIRTLSVDRWAFGGYFTAGGR